MDQDRFDRLAKLLAAPGTRRAGLRAALGGVLGLGAGAAALEPDAEAKRRHTGPDARKRKRRRKKKCSPRCAAGQTCVKGTCRCDNGGTVCGANCCLIGQACENGACVAGPTPACVAPGEPCKGVGRPCCEGRVCASGQGGQADVSCYVAKTGACQSTADCVYGTLCIDGRCGLDAPVGLGEPCNPANQATCSTPGAVCTPYDGPGAPAGTYCTLPLDVTCTGDPDCTCYTCWYPNGTLAATTPAGRRTARAEAPRLACCGPEGYACQSDRNCCLGTSCVNGTCKAVCDVCASGCPYTTIGAAFAATPAGGVIAVAPGEYGGEANRVVATRSMSIVRCGTAGSVVWRAPADNPALKTVTDDAQQGIDLAVVGIDFRWGGGSWELVKIYRPSFAFELENERHDVTFLGCTLVGNGADQALAIESLVTATIADCEFRDNTTSGGGAGLILQGQRIEATIDRCRFLDNVQTGSSGGGGLYLDSYLGQARVSDSVFRGNVTSGNSMGGAILLGQGTLTLHDVTVVGNLATGSAGGTKNNGGGIGVSSSNGRLILSGSTVVTGNAMDSWNGGGSGVYCDKTDSATCREMMASGVSYASIYGNTPAFTECAKDRSGVRQPVDCVTWEPTCVPQGASCPGANACCPGVACGPAGDGTATTCCAAAGAPCSGDNDCCKTGAGNASCQFVDGAFRCQA